MLAAVVVHGIVSHKEIRDKNFTENWWGLNDKFMFSVPLNINSFQFSVVSFQKITIEKQTDKMNLAGAATRRARI